MQLFPTHGDLGVTEKLLQALGVVRTTDRPPTRRRSFVSAAEKAKRRARGKRQRAARSLHRNVRRGNR